MHQHAKHQTASKLRPGGELKPNASEASHDAQQVLPFTQDGRESHMITVTTVRKQYTNMQSNIQQTSSNQEGIQKQTRAKRAMMHSRLCHSHRIAVNYAGLQGKPWGSNTSACKAADSKQAPTMRGLKKTMRAKRAMMHSRRCHSHKTAGNHT